MISKSAQLTADEEGRLKKLLNTKELLKLRHPLQAALLFSPLYLLSGRKVINNSWDQSRMMQVSEYVVGEGLHIDYGPAFQSVGERQTRRSPPHRAQPMAGAPSSGDRSAGDLRGLDRFFRYHPPGRYRRPRAG